MANQDKNDSLNYLTDPTFNKVNRLFAFSLENEEDSTSNSKYNTPKVEIKNKEKTYKKLLKLARIVIIQQLIY